jgi:hypothetical protein
LKGRDTFTSDEVVAIRRLLREKAKADGAGQKSVRSKLRKLGFYISDFAFGEAGFEVADFDRLVANGTIKEQHAALREPEPTPRIGASASTVAGEGRELRAAAAERYRPKAIKVLLVAEAPPNAADRYFYFENVTSHDWLFRGVSEVLLGRVPDRNSKATALAQLRDQGLFLIDLKPTPVDDTDLTRYVPELVARCKALAPERIILIKATVYDAAYRPLRVAGLPVIDKRVFFPSTGRQEDFRRQFGEALRAKP